MIFKSKANKALDKMEDPRETLDYSYQRQLELLQKVRRGGGRRRHLAQEGGAADNRLGEPGQEAGGAGPQGAVRRPRGPCP
ncbi:hypothetical protein GCM10020001_080310 [Nonomuraea salmonea]